MKTILHKPVPGHYKYIVFALVVLLLVSFSSIAAQPEVVSAADEEADVDITLYAIPSVRVARGTILAYKLRIDNSGDGTMAYARVRMPYDRSRLTLVDTLFQSEEDYVLSLDEQTLTLHIGLLGRDGARFVVLYMQVADYLPDGTVLNMWAGFDWEDQHGNYQLERISNAAPVIVDSFNETSDYVWSTVDPFRGPVGTTFRFFSDRFVPGETVRVYLQKSDGSERKLSDGQDVDGNGRVHIHLDSNKIPPGTYNLILRGKTSELESAATITVLPLIPGE